MKRITLISISLFILFLFSNAQENNHPTVNIKNDSLKHLKLNKLKINVFVFENVATITMDMAFYNNTNRTLEGELNLPLNDARMVSRFALEVDGSMREGVIVEKEKGSQVFESVVRNKIDPGLLEMTKGNNFRARIFPILPKSEKNLIIAYDAELILNKKGYVLNLPLHFEDELLEFEIKIEIENQNHIIFNKKQYPFKFEKSENSIVGIFSRTNYKANKSLILQLPLNRNNKNITGKKGIVDSVSYFYYNFQPEFKVKKKSRPEKIAIFWDNSASSEKKEIKKEIDFLQKYVKWIGDAEISFFTFSNTLDSLGTYNIKNGNWSELKEKILSMYYDGATCLGQLDFRKINCDEILLFSDGINNYGTQKIYLSEIPVMVINSNIEADHNQLKLISSGTAGVYINLNELSSSEAFNLATRLNIYLLRAEYEKNEIKDIYPSFPVLAGHSISVAGKIISDKAGIDLIFGYSNHEVYHKKIEINNINPTYNNLTERIWVQKKVEYLCQNIKENKEEITTVGKKYGVVTPTTSLIVLDNIRDYVEHEIVPPPEMQKEYNDLLKKKNEKEYEKKINRLDNVFELYKEKIDWWNCDWEKIRLEKIAKVKQDSIDAIEQIRRDSVLAVEHARIDSLRIVEIQRLNNLQKKLEHKRDSIEKVQLDIERRREEEKKMKEQRIADSLLMLNYSENRKIVSGQVTDIKNKIPLQSVNVRVIGTTNGTITDSEGKYQLYIPENAVLSFSYVGYVTTNFEVTGKSILNVELIEDLVLLDEVIIVGYGVMRRCDLTASVSHIVTQEIRMLDLNNNDLGQINQLPVIELQPWKPDCQYLKKLKEDSVDNMYEKYLALKSEYNSTPSFYIDVASLMIESGDTIEAVKVISNLAEINLQNHEILRILGRKLLEFNENDAAISVFKKVLELRPFEPHSYRDLGLAYAENREYQKAVNTLYKIITHEWSEDIVDKFHAIEIIALGELNNIIVKSGNVVNTDFIDQRFLIDLPVDIRIVLDWDSDNTDMDLWVTDPNNEKCYFSHNRTDIGGYMSEDLTEGYGPEEFLLRNAKPGNYKVEVDYYGNTEQTISGPVTIQVLLFLDYGKSDEHSKRITVRLAESDEEIHIGDMIFQSER